MFKNSEIRLFVLGQVVLASILLFLNWYTSFPSSILMCIGLLGLILSNIVFVYYRYKEIKKLASYLIELQKGEHTLDIRDNKEGELSILKNELYRISIQLNSQAERLLNEKEFLADSLSDISHQLKTPLTSMSMMVELLEQDSLPEEKRAEFVKNIAIGIERMQWLVQSLLKLSKLDAQAIVFNRDRIEVNELITAAVEPLLIPMELKGITLQRIEVEENIFFVGDFLWISEAISNIVKNCMEHTPSQGKIRIQYSDNNLYTKITITDTGNGIDKADLPHIFERFYKGKNSKSESVGIGLALSKEIITQQKGKIEVTSEVGDGTTFSIRFYR